MRQRLAVYPGSFDPATNGHMTIIHRALRLFDHVVVAVARNGQKNPLFTMDERQSLLREALKGVPRVEVDSFEGLLVDYVRKRRANAVIRGLRAVSDFEYEFQMANANRRLNPNYEAVFLMTGEDYFYISSQMVREVASLGGDVSGMVPRCVQRELEKKFAAVRGTAHPAQQNSAQQVQPQQPTQQQIAEAVSAALSEMKASAAAVPPPSAAGTASEQQGSADEGAAAAARDAHEK